MNDDRISRHLHAQADGITLTPADAEGTMRRGNRRRARRRAGLLGGVAVVGVLATTVAVRDTTPDQDVRSLPTASATASSFDWSVVQPTTGLGYGSRAVQLADGSVYSLSTAPGPYREGQDYSNHLYRSDDGAEWDARDLPSAAKTSALAGGGDTLYAVGTSPSGGLVVSASAGGTGDWSSVELPGDLASLKERFGDKVVLGVPRVAAQDATHVVATAVAMTNQDPAKFGHPELNEGELVWRWDDEGLDVWDAPADPCRADAPTASTVVDDTDGLDPAGLDASGAIACRAEAEKLDPYQGEPKASYTFEQLGITGELRDLVGGRTYAYVSEDGTTFQPASVPEDQSSSSYVSDVVATADGYRMVIGDHSDAGGTATVLRSADGHAWTTDTVLSGGPGDLGVLDGRAALTIWDSEGNTTVRIQQPDGSWGSLDLAAAVDAPEGSTPYVGQVAFGPLGLAAVVGTATEDRASEAIVHTRDGATLEVLEVGSVLDGAGQVGGLTVTADAISARVIDPTDGKESTPPTQHVLVGTPR